MVVVVVPRDAKLMVLCWMEWKDVFCGVTKRIPYYVFTLLLCTTNQLGKSIFIFEFLVAERKNKVLFFFTFRQTHFVEGVDYDVFGGAH